ncbi:MAG: hypothetical protein ACI4JK_11555 [Oscillospiraceae bacterium]
MNNKKEIKKALALSNKNTNQLQKELVMIKLCEKLQCVTDAVQRNEFLSG